MANRICNRCGAQFSFRGGPRKYCDECRAADKSLSYNQAYYEAHKGPVVEEDRACGFCGAMFRCSVKARRKFCSDDCRTQATNERIKTENKQRRESTALTCPQCGTTFHASSTLSQKYCSKVACVKRVAILPRVNVPLLGACDRCVRVACVPCIIIGGGGRQWVNPIRCGMSAGARTMSFVGLVRRRTVRSRSF